MTHTHCHCLDKDWYLLKQVLPSVDRICAPLPGTDRAKLMACLHLNTPQPRPRPSSTAIDRMEVDEEQPVENQAEAMEQDGIVPEDDQEEEEGNQAEGEAMDEHKNVFGIKGQHRSKPLALKCSSCEHMLLPSNNNNSSSGLTCNACGACLSVASLYCQTSLAVRLCIQAYYDSPLVCSESACGFETRDRLPIDDVKCLRMNCPGKLIRQYSAGQLYDQIAFFKDTVSQLGENHHQPVAPVLAMLDTMINSSQYNYIDFNAYE
ncbi:hypothetical protein MBANPS3_005269 [Mucor bainieri]